MRLRLWLLILASAAASCSKPAAEVLAIDVRALASAPSEEALSWEDIASVDGFFEIDPGHTRMWGGVQFLDDYAGGNLLVEDRTTDSVLSLDGDGNIVASISRSGNGPQEYLYTSSCYFDADGNIAVRDPMKSKKLVYRPDGSFVSSSDSFAYDGFVFSDGSRALVEMNRGENRRRQFRVYSAEGDTLLAGPLVRPDQTMLSIGGGHFTEDGPDACWFRYDDSDTLFHVNPRSYEPAVIMMRGSEIKYEGSTAEDGTYSFSMSLGRFRHSDRIVAGRYFVYRMYDNGLDKNHYVLYRMDTHEMIYHSSEAPVAKVNGVELHLWPAFVKDGLIWCKVSLDDAPLLIPGYDDGSNQVLVRLKLKR